MNEHFQWMHNQIYKILKYLDAYLLLIYKKKYALFISSKLV
jgi:hypothetical protein